MRVSRRQLLFSDVDGLAFAAVRGKLDPRKLRVAFKPQCLGPLLELLHLSAGGRVPAPDNWLSSSGTAAMMMTMAQDAEGWTAPGDGHAGFIRAVRRGADGDNRLTGFLMKAKRAGRDVSGLPASVAGQLVAAMEELENNIHEHAGAPETGIVAYQAEPGAFEFVVADRGIGVRRSLGRCEAYAALQDEGRALEAALTDGVSRHGPGSNHGHGFRPIFTGLMNLHGELRFRSGDHAVTMNGASPTSATSKIAQKAPIDGFFGSVRCHLVSNSRRAGRESFGAQAFSMGVP